MKRMRTLCLTGLLWMMTCILYAQNQLITYTVPGDGVELKDDFTVRVRQSGSGWKEVVTYPVKVDEVRQTKHHVELASMGYFDFSGQVEVSVTYNKGEVKSSRVRPLSYGITPQISGSTMTFTLDRPRNLSIEVNGDIFHNLHLFANPIDENRPKKLKDKNLIYFAPGIHQLPGDTLNVPSGKTVYVAGGAIVRGCIRAVNARDVKILGRGEVHPEGRGAGISIINSRNIYVEGLITTQCPTGGSDSVTIRNVKAISSYGWGDGMNVFASNNVLFDGVFCRNSDDCTTVYATRMGFHGGCRNVTMQNSTLWADVAHPIFIGLHGDVDRNEVMENLTYRNIDILDHR